MPASSTMTAPAASIRGERPDADPQRLDDRVVDLGRGALAVDLGPEGLEERSSVRRPSPCLAILCHRHILPVHARLSSAGDERRGPRRSCDRVRSRARARRADPVRPGDRARLVGAVRLREHHLLVRGRVRRDRAVPRQGQPVRRARRQRSCCRSRSSSASASTRWCRRSWARSPTAAGGGCRSCCSSPRCASAARSSSRTSRRSSALVLFIVANFAYQAALIYYDATLKTVSTRRPAASCPGSGRGSATAGRSSSALLIFFLDIPVVDRFRLSAVLFLVFAIPIFLFVSEPQPAGRAAADHAADDPRFLRPAQAIDRARPRGARASAGSSSAGSSTRTRSTRSSS